MTPDEARASETREWMSKASDDLASARVLVVSGHLGNALFHCQQAAEKSLKGFLTYHQNPFRRTHDLGELGKACTAIDGSLAALVKQADALSGFAWKLRYPGSPYAPDLKEAETMLALADDIFREVQGRLPEQATVGNQN